MSRTGAAFSVRFLRNGDQITIIRNIVDQSGNGASLFQVVDPNSGAVTPNWGTTANQPIVQIGARSSAGYPVKITDVTWGYNGTTLSFNYNGSVWVTASNDSRFQSRINGDYYELKIVANLASSSVMSNKQITYEINYISNAMTDKVQGSCDVLIQQAGSDSHIIQIATNRVELDDQHTSCVLTSTAMYGTKSVTLGANGYRIEWWQDNVKLNGQTSASLTVTRDMVEGGSIFVAKLYKDDNLVAQDGQRINDIADEYQVSYAPTDAGSNYVSQNHNATYTLSVLKNGSPYSGSATFAWQVYNSLGHPKTSGTGPTVTVKATDCLCGSGDNAYYSDCDVQVTADF